VNLQNKKSLAANQARKQLSKTELCQTMNTNIKSFFSYTQAPGVATAISGAFIFTNL